MKVLVIPDIHLKPHIFKRADELMDIYQPEKAVCLMDIADDWNQKFNLELYEKTYDAAIDFAGKYPETLWCWGNHDICYIWDRRESGYSPYAAQTVIKKISQLRESLAEPSRLAFVHRIDDVLFMHGGMAQEFVSANIPDYETKDMDQIIHEINGMDDSQLWCENSVIWLRPQSGKIPLFRADEFLQVVGHSPLRGILRYGNLISTDVFSTYRNGENIGTCEYVLLDTETHETEYVK